MKSFGLPGRHRARLANSKLTLHKRSPKKRNKRKKKASSTYPGNYNKRSRFRKCILIGRTIMVDHSENISLNALKVSVPQITTVVLAFFYTRQTVRAHPLAAQSPNSRRTLPKSPFTHPGTCNIGACCATSKSPCPCYHRDGVHLSFVPPMAERENVFPEP